MKRFFVILAVTFTFTITGSAWAGLDKTAVSINGSDTNPCSLTAPCATFAAAIAQTNPLGELFALDSGAYDGFTIDRAMSITVAPGAAVTIGQEPGVTNWGIKVNAPGQRVSIRGVMVVTVGSMMGIVAHDAEATYIHDVVIDGSGCEKGCGTGIFGVRGEVFIHNARIRNVYQGILHNPFPPSTMTITDSIIENSGSTGIAVDNHGRATVRNTVVSNTVYAFTSAGSTDTKPELTLIDCMATNSDVGVQAGSFATVRLERTAVTRNVTGLKNAGGTLVSYGNNMVGGNNTNVSGAVSSAGLM